MATAAHSIKTIRPTITAASQVPGKAHIAELSVVCAAANPSVATIAAYSVAICHNKAIHWAIVAIVDQTDANAAIA